jgi:glycosyltransferase involved in cell wall biosynthesis
MKIAIANNLYYPYNRGGAETVVKKMLAELKAEGHEVFLLTTKPKKDKDPVNNQDSVNPELKIYYFPSDYLRLAEIPVYRRLFWHCGNIFYFKKTAAIKKVLRAEKPNLIITHNLMGLGFLLPCAIKKLNIRHEHYIHDIQLLYPSGLMMLGQEKIIDCYGAKFYQIFTRLFFSSVSKVISPSFWLLAQHQQRGFFKGVETEIKTLVAPSETKANEIKFKEAATKKFANKTNFLFVGQIEFHKGIILLIKAFKEALKIKPEIKLTIIGDGSLLDEAKKLSAGEPHIEFKGRLEGASVTEIMKNSDCLIIPSLCYENTPMTIYEAQAVGLPVLAANIGGIPEIINKNDCLFRPGDITDLIKKISS